MASPPTRLGRITAPAAPAPEPESKTRLGRALADHEAAGGLSAALVEIPRLGRAWIVLAGHAAVQRIESEVYREMARLEIALSNLTALTFEAERAVRTLAESVRDPDDHAVRFGTLEEWAGLDPDIIAGAWQVYGDVRERLDPLSIDLTESEAATIRAAIAKKNSALLRSFGVSKLANYLLTTAEPQSTSPIPRSTSGDGSPE